MIVMCRAARLEAVGRCTVQEDARQFNGHAVLQCRPGDPMSCQACGFPVQCRQLIRTQSQVLRPSQALPPWHR